MTLVVQKQQLRVRSIINLGLVAAISGPVTSRLEKQTNKPLVLR
jgi:hypothetical protein